MIDPSLICFYEKTTYSAKTEIGEVIVRVHEPGGEILPLLLGKYNVETWAFITAWNPYSQKKSDAENRNMNLQLEKEILIGQHVFFPGEGKGDDPVWAPEPGFLVLGLSKKQALNIGKKYKQNAIIYGEKNTPAQLLVCL